MQEIIPREPHGGGRLFYEAVNEWGELPWNWGKRGGIPPDELLPIPLIEREQREHLERNFRSRWYLDEFAAFGYPLHDPTAIKRVFIPSVLGDRLIFGKRFGDARDDLILVPSQSDNTIHIKRRSDGIGARQFRRVLFYRVADHPALAAAFGAPTASVQQPSAAPPEKIPYRGKSERLYAEIAANRAMLEKIPEQTGRAEWLAAKVGCSASLAKKILKIEGL